MLKLSMFKQCMAMSLIALGPVCAAQADMAAVASGSYSPGKAAAADAHSDAVKKSESAVNHAKAAGDDAVKKVDNAKVAADAKKAAAPGSQAAKDAHSAAHAAAVAHTH